MTILKNVINDCLPVIDSQKNINIDIKKCLNESGIYNNVKQKSNIESSSVTKSKEPTPSPTDDSSLITEHNCIILGIILSILL